MPDAPDRADRGGARFDAAYYRRFYGSRPVHDARRIGHLATGVLGLAAWWGVPIRSVLDVGAGTGLWRDRLAELRPGARYHGLDVSPYAAARYGHELADLATWWPSARYDLVVCQSVLQYLDDRGADHAIQALAHACRGLLLLEVPTRADRDTVVNPARSDMDVRWRSGQWYRRRLGASFVEVGAGLWASDSLGLPLLELERAR